MLDLFALQALRSDHQTPLLFVSTAFRLPLEYPGPLVSTATPGPVHIP